MSSSFVVNVTLASDDEHDADRDNKWASGSSAGAISTGSEASEVGGASELAGSGENFNETQSILSSRRDPRAARAPTAAGKAKGPKAQFTTKQPSAPPAPAPIASKKAAAAAAASTASTASPSMGTPTQRKELADACRNVYNEMRKNSSAAGATATPPPLPPGFVAGAAQQQQQQQQPQQADRAKTPMRAASKPTAATEFSNVIEIPRTLPSTNSSSSLGGRSANVKPATAAATPPPKRPPTRATSPVSPQAVEQLRQAQLGRSGSSLVTAQQKTPVPTPAPAPAPAPSQPQPPSSRRLVGQPPSATTTKPSASSLFASSKPKTPHGFVPDGPDDDDEEDDDEIRSNTDDEAEGDGDNEERQSHHDELADPAAASQPRRTSVVQDTVKRAMLKRLPAYKWSAVEVRAWLNALGLAQYGATFLENGVDGATLMTLSTDQVREGLGMSDENHVRSFSFGLEDLKTRAVTSVEAWEWTMDKTVAWLEMRGLSSLAGVFRDAAVHGGVLFRLSRDEFAELGIGAESCLTLMALLASIERARVVGPRPATDVAVPDWGPNRVRDWLESLHLGHLAPVFRQHAVNGALLLKLDAGIMCEELGVTEIQGMVLERGIARLRRSHAWDSSVVVTTWRRFVAYARVRAPSLVSAVGRLTTPPWAAARRGAAAAASSSSRSAGGAMQRRGSLDQVPAGRRGSNGSVRSVGSLERAKSSNRLPAPPASNKSVPPPPDSPPPSSPPSRAGVGAGMGRWYAAPEPEDVLEQDLSMQSA